MSVVGGWASRKHWGVVLKRQVDRERDMLLGRGWHTIYAVYPGEPTRPLVFETRRQAREWKRNKLREYLNTQPQWNVKFRVVRVRESWSLEP